ncbi:hypothetical protein CBF90_02120 [Microbacterium sp. AISO3]|uniref:MobF family relaxase n=1 Tax=Microbacterium sp. AISO3 TaxID=2002831 RepID=UPI000B4CB2DE|nr:MobF family relaxase [Microbacterium sp. AISO3]OWP20302.1 hypothetical protein CBF90_17125 [Microbacterium sp. AISO3]OWP23545.1 hypothetical protein CBF90_02120 [Microbacterium sp. AISO3]
MRGGVVFYRGPGSTARAYLESDHSHADEYYLENGDAIAEWSAYDTTGTVRAEAQLDGDAYQSWVDWRDPLTGEVRGDPRDEVRIDKNGDVVVRPASPRFAEMTVNCDKSLSVAAALFPEVSAALDAAQAEAVKTMGTYMAQNSVTRVGPRGAQEFVPVERLEQVAVVHRTSRAGDPHRHIHVQWNTRVFADGKWRGLHTAATLKQQGALRGIAEAVINSHAGLRQALRSAGLTFDASTGKVVELAQHAEVMSKRALQVQNNVSLLEQEWRELNPGEEPIPGLIREWDQKAWAIDRPQKVHAPGRAEDRWLSELEHAGLQTEDFGGGEPQEPIALDDVDRAQVAEHAVAALEGIKSAWSVADLEGEIGVVLGKSGVVASRPEIEAWVKSTAATTADALRRLDIRVEDVPDWVRWITSDRVVEVETKLRSVFAARARASELVLGKRTIGKLSQAQSDAARALGGKAPLVVVEGAAGAGKTTMLKTAAKIAAKNGRRFVVAAPTLRAAQEAGEALGTPASSAHKLAHEHGFRRDALGRWKRLQHGDIDPLTQRAYDGPSEGFHVDDQTRIVVDEAGMIDQDIAHALVEIAEENGALLALVGDRAQLPAVGRGGVLDMAVEAHPQPLDLTDLHRFQDRQYAELTLQMRSRERPEELFDRLYERGNLVVHDTMEAAHETIAADAIARARAGASVAIATATNEEANALNALVQRAHAEAGHTTAPAVEVTGSDMLTIRNGDRLMTRKNNTELRVANCEVWKVQRVHPDQSVTVSDGKRKVQLPADYVKQHTHLAYAATEFGVQGATVQAGHGIVTDASNASAVYVSATRGRASNTLHLVAGTPEQAKEVFVGAMQREVGDRGVTAKAGGAARDLDGMVGTRRTITDSQREQAAWWGVDVERPTPRAAAPADAAADSAEEAAATRSASGRTPEAAARAAHDTEATRIARDAEQARQAARGRGLER